MVNGDVIINIKFSACLSEMMHREMNASASINDCFFEESPAMIVTGRQRQASRMALALGSVLDSNELNPLASLLFIPTVLQNCGQ